MRERSRTTPRRRGPKAPLPPPRREHYDEQFEQSESPYYTIDNTEDIYGTTLLPSQRCYVDPWDLENYDYVRKKLNTSPPRSTPERYYDSSLSASPYYMPPSPPLQEELPLAPPPRMAATMPRNRRRSHWNEPCTLECCTALPTPRRRTTRYEDSRSSELYSGGRGPYDDYMLHMTQQLHLEEEAEDVYTGYGGFSSSSSTERHSSIEDDCLLLPPPAPVGYATNPRPRRALAHPKPAPQLEFPAPPSLPPPSAAAPTYDYCNPYSTLPYCSVSECYDCSLIYATPPSTYGTSSGNIYGSTLGRRPSSSLYGGIYGHKFGLSKKGLLQIDYSCSWNDLDRVMGRHF